MALDAFWQSIDTALDTIAADQAQTFDAVKVVLDAHGNPGATDYGTATPDAAFFGGSGGDRTLSAALYAAGWRMPWCEASYYYIMVHPTTGETLTYCEGDVMRGNTTGHAL